MDTKVIIEQGALCGKIQTTYNNVKYFSYQGIPYAKPPLKELRFQPPVEPDPWIGVLQATAEANACIAKSFDESNSYVGSEDCLYLNIYTKEQPNLNKPLKPVMVWIHGGGFIKGSGNTDLNGPDYLIQEDIVLVTFNYRLGLLGFLPLIKNPQANVSMNVGLKDIIVALRWVQKNIGAFNGDPGNVTVFGASAGAIAIHTLLYSPLAKGLFHKVICQSGTAFNSCDTKVPVQDITTFTEAAGYTFESELEAIQFLKQASAEELVDMLHLCLQTKMKNRYNLIVGPLIEPPGECALLTGNIEDILKRDDIIKVPLLIGTNENDGSIYASKQFPDQLLPVDFTDPELLIPRYLKRLTDELGISAEIGDRFVKHYYGLETPSRRNIQKYVNYQTDYRFNITSKKAIKYYLEHSAGPVYYYKFSLDSPYHLYKKMYDVKLSGATHGDELTYLFYTKFHSRLKFGITERNTIHRLVKFWTTFAKSGNPNPGNNDPLLYPEWKPVERNVYNHLNIGQRLRMVNSQPDAKRIEFWDKIFAECGYKL